MPPSHASIYTSIHTCTARPMQVSLELCRAAARLPRLRHLALRGPSYLHPHNLAVAAVRDGLAYIIGNINIDNLLATDKQLPLTCVTKCDHRCHPYPVVQLSSCASLETLDLDLPSTWPVITGKGVKCGALGSGPPLYLAGHHR